ncbi:choice-of-anchor L domain-containing protein [bacterium]|nr:choice-of-anchor L domain-containing protein [bacterium]
MLRRMGILIFIGVFAVVLGAACTKDDAEDAAEALGFEITFDEDDVGAATPDGWHFMFAIKLDEDQAGLIDEDFAIDLSLLSPYIDFSEIDQMIAMAKVADIPGYGTRLRFANRLIVKDEKLRLDSDNNDLLGDSVGSDGAGTYAAYYADEQNGFIRGDVVDCDGDALEGLLAIITGSPFFTHTASNGSWALPTLEGKPQAYTVFGDDCACSGGAPCGDTNATPNPKDPDGTPDSETFDDETVVVDSGECVCCPPEPVDDDDDDMDDDDMDDDTSDDDTGDDDTGDDDTGDDDTGDDDTGDDDTSDDDTGDDDTSDDDTADDDTADDDDDDDDDDADDDDDDGTCVNFEDGSLSGWSFTSGCNLYGVSSDGYGTLFEDGSEGAYLYVSSGGSDVASCTLSATFDVPDGATEIEISYNFVSQEYEEWVGSIYNDIFTAIVQGAPDYLVNRTVNNIATDDDWLAIGDDSPAATIAGIAGSADAAFNPTSDDPHSNGPQLFDGILKWDANAGENPRGEPEDDNVGKTATVMLPEDQTTVTVLVTVSDVGDRIYDSAGAIDWMCFR